jgi:hypothetical protein
VSEAPQRDDPAKRGGQKSDQSNVYAHAKSGGGFNLRPVSDDSVGLNDPIPFAPEIR